jgi:hypothetical protein
MNRKKNTLELSGYVRNQKNEGINGVAVKAYRSNQLLDKVLSKSDPISKEGWYTLPFASEDDPIDVIYYFHTSYHLAALVPLCGIDNHSVSPVLLPLGQQLNPAHVWLQISTYEFALCHLVQLATVTGMSPVGYSLQAREDVMEIAKEDLPKLQDLREFLPNDATKNIYDVKIRKLIRFCENCRRDIDFLQSDSLIDLLA